jgi:uncharacterized membrane protein YgdD (TMEM256/DUF423 family)
MMYWIREIAGWLLVALGVLIFVTVYEFCERRWIFEAGILAVVGIFVFRGGIHLLKVAVAARVAQQAQRKLEPATLPTRAGARPPSAPAPASSRRR